MNKRPKKNNKKFKVKSDSEQEKTHKEQTFFASKVIEKKRGFTVRPDKKRG